MQRIIRQTFAMEDFVNKFQAVRDKCDFLSFDYATSLWQQAQAIEVEYKRAMCMEHVIKEYIKIHDESCTSWANMLMSDGAEDVLRAKIRDSYVGFANGETWWERCASGWAESNKLKEECAVDHNKLMIVLFNISDAANILYEKLEKLDKYVTRGEAGEACEAGEAGKADESKTVGI
jgi:hypothetical protein